jgi:glutathione S-transferase
MSLKLYFHPLTSFCWKVLIALYENDTPFEPHIVDLGDERSSTEFKRIWPIGKFPVLHDKARNVTVPESSIIIEYLSHHYPGGTELVPKDTDLALQARQWDRVYDFYVHEPMQKIVGDRLRPPGKTDAQGVEQAKALLDTAYSMVDREMAAKTWAIGDKFTMADCAAAPALFYANKVLLLGEHYRNVARYLDRLLARPSFARTVQEAQPYFALFPQ